MAEATKTTYKFSQASALGNKEEDDGITHINIHSRGKTDLGVSLSHFAHTPFTHPYFGYFYSMEGLWYYLRAAQTFAKKDMQKLSAEEKEVWQRMEKSRFLSGYRAKLHGKDLPYCWYSEFKEDIIAANYQKIIQTPGLAEKMAESTLPFDHYYVGKNKVHITPNNFDWLCAGFDEIRRAIKEGQVPACWINAEKRYRPA